MVCPRCETLSKKSGGYSIGGTDMHTGETKGRPAGAEMYRYARSMEVYTIVVLVLLHALPMNRRLNTALDTIQ